MNRVDFAITRPGLIKGAMCHSLFLTDEGLYVIRVSRGWRIGFSPRGAVNQMAANAAINHWQEKARAESKNIDASKLTVEVENRKGSFFVKYSDISNVEGQKNPNLIPAVMFKANGKKYIFDFEWTEEDKATAFLGELLKKAA